MGAMAVGRQAERKKQTLSTKREKTFNNAHSTRRETDCSWRSQSFLTARTNGGFRDHVVKGPRDVAVGM